MKIDKIGLNKLILYKLIWLVCLSVFFFATYNLANWITSLRSDVGSLFFTWETYIPLWSWTIVPYWSIDLMYGLAILLATSNQSLKTLGFRLLSAQIICVVCFLIFPLKFSFERPELDGIFGLLFDILMGFDKPFNQAPSLHITLLVILWQFYANYFRSYWRYILHGWCLLIALSVLTTWQHHFVDIPTGLWVSCFCIWLWPEKGIPPLKNCCWPKQYGWGSLYLILAIFCFIIAIYYQSWALWLLWLSGSFWLVAINYLILGARGFQKQNNGHFSFAITILYAPYLIIMWANSRLWTYKNQQAALICENVYLGRIPNQKELKRYDFLSIVDLCAELPIGKFSGNYALIPVLDMTLLSVANCLQAAQLIEQYNQQGKLLVCCALGYSRSASAIIAWLLWSQRANSVNEAIAMVRQGRAKIVISERQKQLFHDWLADQQVVEIEYA